MVAALPSGPSMTMLLELLQAGIVPLMPVTLPPADPRPQYGGQSVCKMTVTSAPVSTILIKCCDGVPILQFTVDHWFVTAQPSLPKTLPESNTMEIQRAGR